MMKAIRYKIYSLFTSKTLRSLMLFAVLFLLSGCKKYADTSAGKDGNLAAQIDCWQTSITQAVTYMLNDLYNHSAGAVAGGGANLILIAFAIWMAFKLLKVLGSFKEENLGEVWTEIFQKLFLCAFCAFIILETKHIDDAINMFVLPIYHAIIELGLRVLDDSRSGVIDLGIFGKLVFGHDNEICPINSNTIEMSSLKENIDYVSGCIVCRISSRLNTGVQIGINLIASVRLGAVLVGLALMLFFTVAKIFFIFFLIDSLFRLNFAVYLLPILIMGVPFNYTRKWSKHGFLMFLNSSGIMLFIGLLVSVAVGAIESVVIGPGPGYNYDDFEGFGTAMLVVFLISILLINIPAMGVALADKFIGGGGGMEFQQKVSKFAMNLVKKAGSAVLASLTGGTTSLITKTMEKHETTREILSNLREKNNSLSNSINSLGGHNDD